MESLVIGAGPLVLPYFCGLRGNRTRRALAWRRVGSCGWLEHEAVEETKSRRLRVLWADQVHTNQFGGGLPILPSARTRRRNSL